MKKGDIEYCGWDVGGAHLKFVGMSADGTLIAVKQLKCPLWLGIEHLIQAIRQIKGEYSLSRAEHAITMTGELCDNFKNRVAGVNEIINGIYGELEPRDISFYGLEDQWYSAGESLCWQSLASANWYASARFVGRQIPNAVVIDVGSTTVDIIPVVNGRVASQGQDDFTRLKYRELVYTGLVRTPVSTMVRYLPFHDEMIPIVAESFSNAADVYRILGLLPESADLYPPMDGGGKTRSDSARRLFRMIGRDFDGELEIAQAMAEYIRQSQLSQLRKALLTVLKNNGFENNIGPETTIVGLGCGAQLVEQLAAMLTLKYHAFDDMFQLEQLCATDCKASVCAPAAAVATELRIMRTST